MEVYILDDLFRREQIVDRFESLIWTERHRSYGDFELSMPSSRENRNRFAPGTNLAHNESLRVMTVETVQDDVDDEGRQIMTFKGKSLESALEHRMARGSWADTVTEPRWVMEGLPAALVRKIFHDICVAGILDPADVLPFIHEGSTLFPADTIAEPTETITYEIEPMTVYKATTELCDRYGIGFRLVRNFDQSELWYDVYMGSDRTTKQTVYPPVIFSPDLDNMHNTSELTTISAYRNIAYVISPSGHQIVPETGLDPNVSGFNRRILIVDADDITDFTPEIANPKMIQRGLEELARNRRFSAFDGEISQYSQYRYGIDYNLGDLVELRSSNGVTNDMQVTEQIFVSDREGERSYPTLALNQFIMPGTWLSWNYNQVWADLGLTEYWANQ